MEFSLIVARILAIYLVVSGLFLIFKRKTLPMLLKDFFDHPAVVYLAGLLLIVFGSVLMFKHDVWDGNLRTMITVFGALVFGKGLVYIFAPGTLANLHVERSRPAVIIAGIIAIALGAWLWCLS